MLSAVFGAALPGSSGRRSSRPDASDTKPGRNNQHPGCGDRCLVRVLRVRSASTEHSQGAGTLAPQ